MTAIVNNFNGFISTLTPEGKKIYFKADKKSAYFYTLNREGKEVNVTSVKITEVTFATETSAQHHIERGKLPKKTLSRVWIQPLPRKGDIKIYIIGPLRREGSLVWGGSECPEWYTPAVYTPPVKKDEASPPPPPPPTPYERAQINARAEELWSNIKSLQKVLKRIAYGDSPNRTVSGYILQDIVLSKNLLYIEEYPEYGYCEDSDISSVYMELVDRGYYLMASKEGLRIIGLHDWGNVEETIDKITERIYYLKIKRTLDWRVNNNLP